MNNQDTIASLRYALSNGVLTLDGSMGVMLQRLRLSDSETKGHRFMTHPYPLAGDFDVLCLSRPELVAEVHWKYLEAGADIIETNTFNSNSFSQARYGLSDRVEEMNIAGARLAKSEADRFMSENPGKRCFVAGSMGPTGMAASLSSDVNDPAARSIDFMDLAHAFEEQAKGLIKGGVDFLLVETVFDLLNAKAAVFGINRARKELNSETPFVLSITVSETSGRILSGHTIESFVTAMSSFNPLAMGINCSAGPDKLVPFLRELTAVSPFPVIFYPNAGHPDELGNYAQTPEIFSSEIKKLLDEGLLNIVGGCCGTTPEHMHLISALAKDAEPRHVSSGGSGRTGWLAALDVFHDDRGFINVGERCNVAGSRKFLRLIKEKSYDEALSIARRQVADGAVILDLNFDDGLLDAQKEMVHFLRLLSSDPETAAVPWMIDSSDFNVIEAALQNVPGKAIVNSISLKHGEEEFMEQARIIASYGAAVVVMLFDEIGQATDYERKIEIAARSYRILTEKCGYSPEDIIIDSNVLSIATGMSEHDAYARDFIKAVRWIKDNLPGAKTSGGISNLSFAFRGNNYLRQAMHAVFLYHAVKAGLSMAILDPSTKVTYSDIPDKLLTILEDLILLRRKDAADRLIAVAGDYAGNVVDTANTSESAENEDDVEKRLVNALRTGDDSRLEVDLAEAMQTLGSANAVVEGPLMLGMEIVGKLFEEGKMFLPQVVKSARTMHRAVSVLTPFLKKNNDKSASKGTFIIATVKGDVHDIGKNIAKVVLECNNYKVIDLGVQVETAAILEAVKTYNPDFIGLSGLIAPSLNEMVDIAAELERNSIHIPLFVGGAATSELHTALKIAPSYPGGIVVRVGDAAQNPIFAGRLMADYENEALRIKDNQKRLVEEYTGNNEICVSEERNDSSFKIDWNKEKFEVPSFTGCRRLSPVPVGDVEKYINWIYFLNCWNVNKETPEADTLLADARRILRDLKTSGATLLAEVAFYDAFSEKGGIRINDEFLPTPRQKNKPGREKRVALCDFVAPEGYGDHVGCFCVTIGDVLREKIEMARKSWDDYELLLLQSICDRLTEAASEYVHTLVRRDLWGYAKDESLDMEDIKRGKYRGIRPAIGYPSLPDQRQMHTLARLLDFGDIGVTITENGALAPSSTVAGIYIAAAKSHYFTLG